MATPLNTTSDIPSAPAIDSSTGTSTPARKFAHTGFINPKILALQKKIEEGIKGGPLNSNVSTPKTSDLSSHKPLPTLTSTPTPITPAPSGSTSSLSTTPSTSLSLQSLGQKTWVITSSKGNRYKVNHLTVNGTDVIAAIQTTSSSSAEHKQLEALIQKVADLWEATHPSINTGDTRTFKFDDTSIQESEVGGTSETLRNLATSNPAAENLITSQIDPEYQAIKPYLDTLLSAAPLSPLLSSTLHRQQSSSVSSATKSVGIPNTGLDCFINSTAQLIMHNSVLKQALHEVGDYYSKGEDPFSRSKAFDLINQADRLAQGEDLDISAFSEVTPFERLKILLYIAGFKEFNNKKLLLQKLINNTEQHITKELLTRINSVLSSDSDDLLDLLLNLVNTSSEQWTPLSSSFMEMLDHMEAELLQQAFTKNSKIIDPEKMTLSNKVALNSRTAGIALKAFIAEYEQAAVEQRPVSRDIVSDFRKAYAFLSNPLTGRENNPTELLDQLAGRKQGDAVDVLEYILKSYQEITPVENLQSGYGEMTTKTTWKPFPNAMPPPMMTAFEKDNVADDVYVSKEQQAKIHTRFSVPNTGGMISVQDLLSHQNTTTIPTNGQTSQFTRGMIKGSVIKHKIITDQDACFKKETTDSPQFTKLPSTLVFTLDYTVTVPGRRTRSTQGVSTKIKIDQKIHLEREQIAEELRESNLNYELTSFNTHKRSSQGNGGHYVTYIKQGENWTRYDDSTVTTNTDINKEVMQIFNAQTKNVVVSTLVYTNDSSEPRISPSGLLQTARRSNPTRSNSRLNLSTLSPTNLSSPKIQTMEDLSGSDEGIDADKRLDSSMSSSTTHNSTRVHTSPKPHVSSPITQTSQSTKKQNKRLFANILESLKLRFNKQTTSTTTPSSLDSSKDEESLAFSSLTDQRVSSVDELLDNNSQSPLGRNKKPVVIQLPPKAKMRKSKNKNHKKDRSSKSTLSPTIVIPSHAPSPSTTPNFSFPSTKATHTPLLFPILPSFPPSSTQELNTPPPPPLSSFTTTETPATVPTPPVTPLSNGFPAPKFLPNLPRSAFKLNNSLISDKTEQNDQVKTETQLKSDVFGQEPQVRKNRIKNKLTTIGSSSSPTTHSPSIKKYTPSSNYIKSLGKSPGRKKRKKINYK